MLESGGIKSPSHGAAMEMAIDFEEESKSQRQIYRGVPASGRESKRMGAAACSCPSSTSSSYLEREQTNEDKLLDFYRKRCYEFG